MGWPIATRVIEGACRYLVNDRLAITGARWSLPGAEAVLLLHAVITNGDFDTYWKFRLQQEHQRAHAMAGRWCTFTARGPLAPLLTCTDIPD